MKGLKITNIVLLSLLAVAQFFAIYFIVPVFQLVVNKESAAGFAILALLPMFLLFTAAVFVLSIILSATTKKLKNLIISNGQSPNFFIKMSGWIGWIFLLINIVSFVLLYIV